MGVVDREVPDNLVQLDGNAIDSGRADIGGGGFGNGQAGGGGTPTYTQANEEVPSVHQCPFRFLNRTP